MEIDFYADEIKNGLSIRQALSGPRDTIELAFRAIKNEKNKESSGRYINNPAKRVLSKKVFLESDLGTGYYEFVYLSDDLYMLISNCSFSNTHSGFVPGEGFLEFHFKLNGQLDMISEDHDRFSVYGPSVLVWGQSKGVDLQEIIRGGIDENSVTLYLRKTLLTEKLGLLPSALPSLLQRFVKDRSYEILYDQIPMQPQMIVALREILNSPYAGNLRLIHQETKAYELLCSIIWAMQQKNDGDISQIKITSNDLVKIKEIGEYINSNFNMQPTISHMARMVGINQTKLKIGFKKAFGVTVFDYCQQLKMAKASNLLKETELSISEIAYQVGYEHQSSFTAAFKRYYGLLPKNIRH